MAFRIIQYRLTTLLSTRNVETSSPRHKDPLYSQQTVNYIIMGSPPPVHHHISSSPSSIPASLKPNERDPTQASYPTTNMCQGINYLHEQCNHSRKFVVLAPCNQGTGAGCPNATTIHVMKITAPRLCVQCFRQKEADIDAEYEDTKRNLDEEIARVVTQFANGYVLTEEAAVNLRGYLEDCEDNIVQAKASRDLSIRLFRQRQGVWGDG